MGYYIRILTTGNGDVPIVPLISAMKAEGIEADIVPIVEEGSRWVQLEMRSSDGKPFALLERNDIAPDLPAGEEIREFEEEIEGCKPDSAAVWLRAFLPRVKAIYAFQILTGSIDDKGWAAVDTALAWIHSGLGGIVQADGEGFTNEDGNHILWQFDDGVSGPWKMAVLDEGGQWQAFQMDLGDRKQRKEFFKGKIPPTARRI